MQAYDQIISYMDTLNLAEGWLVVFDSDFTKPWEEKISSKDLTWRDRTIHLLKC